VRIAFPLLAALAVALFVSSALAAAALSLLLPVAIFAMAVGVLLRAQVFSAARLFRLGLQSVVVSFRYCGDVVRCIFAPRSGGPALDDSAFPAQYVRLKPPQFIELHRAQQQVAAALRVAPADELWMSPGTELGIGETTIEGQKVRFLVVGLGLLRILSATELRAALAHEFGHARAGHLRLGRFLRHSLDMLILAQLRFRWFDPACWGSTVSAAVMRAIYLPWSRAREFEADRIAAGLAGADAIIGTLRKIREHGPAMSVALGEVLRRSVERRSGPEQLSATAIGFAALLPQAERRRLSVQFEGDPLDLGGRTHPPVAARINAAQQVQTQGELPPAVELPPERLAQLDRRLTFTWLAALSVRSQVTAPAMATPTTFPEERPRTREELEAPTSDGLELDLDGTWREGRNRG
jgi:Zn-dependent protease with chaperone function